MDELRKIQVTGRNTYIVSLPYEWVTKKGLTKGAGVYLSENSDDTLTLALKKGERLPKACTITVSHSSFDSSMRNLVSAYIGGVDKIILRGEGTSLVAEEARRILSGVEIAEETTDSITLQILTFDNLSADNILKRLFNVVQSMYGLAISALESGKKVQEELARKEDDVDRLYILLLRNLCLGNRPSKETVFQAIAAKSMEKISDHLVELASEGKADSDAITELLGKAFNLYILAFESFLKGDMESRKFTELKKAFKADLERIDASLKKEKSAAKIIHNKSQAEKCLKLVRYCEDLIETGGDMVFAQLK
jgi:phosphate uptake regulator